MKLTTWGVLGSLVANLALGLLVAALFSVATPASAAEHCGSSARTQHSVRSPERPAKTHHGYLVAARMGWAAG